MIKKVYGKANNLDITFTYNEQKGLYDAAIPRSVNGSYFLDLYAEDVAGNVTFMATALFEFDPSSFKCSLKVIDYAENAMMEEFKESLSNGGFNVIKNKKKYDESLALQNRYEIEVVKICCS
ncbi:MAG: PF13754 domain-containing protein [Massilimicrobiota timonensis]